MRVKRILIEFDHVDAPPVELGPLDGVELSMDRGVHEIWRPSFCIDQYPNGQLRVTIKAWKGCDSYDSFQAFTNSLRVGGENDVPLGPRGSAP